MSSSFSPGPPHRAQPSPYEPGRAVKLAADEGIDRHRIEALRAAGHDVLWFVEYAPGADDPTVLRATTAKAVRDLDAGDAEPFSAELLDGLKADARRGVGSRPWR